MSRRRKRKLDGARRRRVTSTCLLTARGDRHRVRQRSDRSAGAGQGDPGPPSVANRPPIPESSTRPEISAAAGPSTTRRYRTLYKENYRGRPQTPVAQGLPAGRCRELFVQALVSMRTGCREVFVKAQEPIRG